MNAEATLDISIALATHNRGHVLRRMLRSLTRLETSGIRWEVVVVDNFFSEHRSGRQPLFPNTLRLPLPDPKAV